MKDNNRKPKGQEVKRAGWLRQLSGNLTQRGIEAEMQSLLQKAGCSEDKKASYLLKHITSPFGEMAVFSLRALARKLENRERGLNHRTGSSEGRGYYHVKNLFPHSPITSFPSRKTAFTLAEVLITLGIIGVVAAMTMPSLIQNQREKQYVTQLKKTVSILDNAYHLLIYENGGTKDLAGYKEAHYVKDTDKTVYNENENSNSDVFYTELSKYLKVMKDCGRQSDLGCFPETFKDPFNDKIYDIYKAQGNSRRWFILDDGTSVGVTKDFAYIDVNGQKLPNTLGADIFQIGFGDNGVTYYDDASGAVKCYTNPFTCSSWALQNENLDYLHCNDLSWNGKHKCK